MTNVLDFEGCRKPATSVLVVQGNNLERGRYTAYMSRLPDFAATSATQRANELESLNWLVAYLIWHGNVLLARQDPRELIGRQRTPNLAGGDLTRNSSSLTASRSLAFASNDSFPEQDRSSESRPITSHIRPKA